MQNGKNYDIEYTCDLLTGYTVKVCDGTYTSAYIIHNHNLEKFQGKSLEEWVIQKHELSITQSLDYRHDGPTNRELEDPQVRYAWEEFQIIRKLIGKQK